MKPAALLALLFVANTTFAADSTISVVGRVTTVAGVAGVAAVSVEGSAGVAGVAGSAGVAGLAGVAAGALAGKFRVMVGGSSDAVKSVGLDVAGQ